MTAKKKKGKKKGEGKKDVELGMKGYRKALLGAAVVVVLVVVILSFSMKGDVELEKEGGPQDLGVDIHVDSISKGAFDYINEYRIDNGLGKFDFVDDVYLVAIEMSKDKEENKLLFRQAPERNEFIESSIDLSKFPVQYNTIYSVDGLGLDGFVDEFDRIYFIQNIIKTDKYDSGAVGCTENYCTLILLGTEGAIEIDRDF